MSAATFTRETVSERRGGVRDYVSPSRLNLWLKCPLAFKLRYIDGVESPTSLAQFVGKLVHAGLELHYRHRQIGVTLPTEELYGRLGDLWDHMDAVERPVFPTTADEIKC